MNDLEQLAGAGREAAYLERVRHRSEGAPPCAGDAQYWGFFAGIGVWIAWTLCPGVLLLAVWAAGFLADRPARVIIHQNPAPQAPYRSP